MEEKIYYCKKCDRMFAAKMEQNELICKKCGGNLISCNLTEKEYIYKLINNYGFRELSFDRKKEYVSQNVQRIEETNNETNYINLFLNQCKNKPSFLVTVITLLITLGTLSVQFVSLIWITGYLSFFGVSAADIPYADFNGGFNVIFSFIIFVGILIAVTLIYYAIDLYNRQRLLRKMIYSTMSIDLVTKIYHWFKDIRKNALYYIFEIICLIGTNYFILMMLVPIEMGKQQIIIFSAGIIVLVIFEYYIARNFYPVFKKNNCQVGKKRSQFEKKIDKLETYAKANLPIILNFSLSKLIISAFFVSMTIYLSARSFASIPKDYSIIDEKYVVLYQMNDYYWTMEMKDEDGKLVVITSRRKSIPIIETTVNKIFYGEVDIE